MVDLITQLPTGIVAAVLCEWLNLESLAALDSAQCNSQQRQFLHEIFASLKYPNAPPSLLEWLLTKKISVESITLSDDADIDMFRNYVRKLGESMRTLRLSEVDTIKADIVMCTTLYCKRIKAFVCDDSTYDNSISNLLDCCKSLEELRLGKYNVVPIIVKHKYPDLGPKQSNLRSISTTQFHFLESLLSEVPSAAFSTVRLNLNSCKDMHSASKDVSLIASFTKLTSLSLYACTFNDADIITIVKACSHLVHLDLSISANVTDVSVTYAAQHLPALRTFNIELTSITDASLLAIAQHHGEHLVALYFADCAAITAVGVNAILQRCLVLRTLSMATYQSTSFEEPLNFPALANLLTLTIEGRQEADDMLTAVAKQCKKLRHLRLVCFAPNICTDRGLTEIALHCEQLQLLVLVGEAPQIGTLALSLWNIVRPKLNITYDRNMLTYHILDRTECI
eukprot:gene15425-17643_t